MTEQPRTITDHTEAYRDCYPDTASTILVVQSSGSVLIRLWKGRGRRYLLDVTYCPCGRADRAFALSDASIDALYSPTARQARKLIKAARAGWSLLDYDFGPFYFPTASHDAKDTTMMPMQVRAARTWRAAKLAYRGTIAPRKVLFVARTGAPSVLGKDGNMVFTDRALERIYFQTQPRT